MKRRMGRLLVILGVVAFAMGFSLALTNALDALRAKRAAQSALEAVQTAIESGAQAVRPSADAPSGAGAAVVEREETSAPAALDPDVGLDADGARYLGYLSVPALELELPVYAEWDDLRVQTAPCRYSGSIADGALVIGAHNYDKHFGRIGELAAGDVVVITDANGAEHKYTVSQREILNPDEVERMKSPDWALSLFTCTYGGGSRVTVRCEREG